MGEFEWILDVEALRSYLQPEYLCVGSENVIVVGCGRSALSKELTRVYGNVVSVDNDNAVIETMRAAEPSLCWICADSCSSGAMDSVLRAEYPGVAVDLRFDVVVDKGTLDAVLCEDGKAAGLICECYRLLKPGGVYFCVSLRSRELLDRLLGPGGPLDWTYEATPLEAPNGEHFSLVLLRRPMNDPQVPDLAAIQSHCAFALDSFFLEACPMLTPEREASIRCAFANRSQELGSKQLPLPEVYAILFTEMERSEYKLEDFLQDVAGVGIAPGGGESMSVDQAIKCLQECQ